MIDLDRTFREAEHIPVTDLWPGIVTRTPAELPPQRQGRRVTAVVVALIVGILGVGLVLRALSREMKQPATPSPTPTVSIVGQHQVITHGLQNSPSMWQVLLAVDVKTGDSRTLVECPDPAHYRVSVDGCLGPAAWAPDGRTFAYTVNCLFPPSGTRCDRQSGIWIGNIRGETQQLVSFDGSQQDGWATRPPRPSFAWSPDGTEIAYVSPAESGGLYIAHADGNGSRLLQGTDATGHGTTDAIALGTTPLWSPDGSRIAYVSGNAVYIVPIDGGAPIRLAEGQGPAWSPDGTYLAFMRGASCDDCEIDVATADGSGLTKVGEQGSSIVWSPDGSRLAYQVERPGERGFEEGVRIVSPDGASRTEALRSECCAGIVFGTLNWSPDGEWIAFFVFDDSTWHVTRSDGSTADVPLGQLQEVDRLQVMSWNPCQCTYEPDR